MRKSIAAMDHGRSGRPAQAFCTSPGSAGFSGPTRNVHRRDGRKLTASRSSTASLRLLCLPEPHLSSHSLSCATPFDHPFSRSGKHALFPALHLSRHPWLRLSIPCRHFSYLALCPHAHLAFGSTACRCANSLQAVVPSVGSKRMALRMPRRLPAVKTINAISYSCAVGFITGIWSWLSSGRQRLKSRKTAHSASIMQKPFFAARIDPFLEYQARYEVYRLVRRAKRPLPNAFAIQSIQPMQIGTVQMGHGHCRHLSESRIGSKWAAKCRSAAETKLKGRERIATSLKSGRFGSATWNRTRVLRLRI
jgi:hypothetical protein